MQKSNFILAIVILASIGSMVCMAKAQPVDHSYENYVRTIVMMAEPPTNEFHEDTIDGKYVFFAPDYGDTSRGPNCLCPKAKVASCAEITGDFNRKGNIESQYHAELNWPLIFVPQPR
jgi:hypothetical protein